MPIAINGSGTITGISVGGIPDGTVDTDVLAANAVTYAKIGTTEQGQLCKAWVNFDGTGTVAIHASYNVSSITDNGTGDYTVNFTSALADANYATVITADIKTSTSVPSSNGGYIGALNRNAVATASAVRVETITTSALTDTLTCSVAIFR
jgi:hypothetical protein